MVFSRKKTFVFEQVWKNSIRSIFIVVWILTSLFYKMVSVASFQVIWKSLYFIVYLLDEVSISVE